MGIKLGLTAAVAGLALSTGALAADLGGNCCADLEERVAELEATTARKGNRAVSLTVYGQVNKAILWADVDGDSDWAIIDNTNSATRIGVRGSAKVAANVEFGYVIELGIGDNGGADPADNNDLTTRHSYVYVSGQMGTLTLGHTSLAADGVAEISLSSANEASTMLSLEPLTGAGLIPFGSPFDSGRGDVVKYTTPIFGGFTASVAFQPGAGGDDVWDAALRYAGEFGAIRVAAGIGYRDEDTNGTSAFGSASVMHIPSGLFIQGAYGKLKDNPILDDLSAWHVQGGFETKVVQFGSTTLYAEFADVDDLDSTMYGGGFVQNIDAAATSLYLGLRQYNLPGSGDDLTTVVAGAKVRF